jgi:hypothetical protein
MEAIPYDKETNLRGGCPLWSFATDALGAPLSTMTAVPRKPTSGSSPTSVVMGQRQTFRRPGGQMLKHVTEPFFQRDIRPKIAAGIS